MDEICKNCEYNIVMNFCANCGQRKTKRIDRTYLTDELQYTFFHMNKGFFYSVKQLIKNPGKTAREFVEGNRVNHYKPILLVFLLSGIVAFLTNTLVHPGEVYKVYNELQLAKQPKETVEMMREINEASASMTQFMMKYYSLITLLVVVPLMSICTWITYRKWGYNFYENIVANSYYYSLLMVFTTFMVLPAQFFLKNNPGLFMFIPMILSLFGAVSTYFWFYIGFYNKKSPGDVIVRSVIMISILMGSIAILSVLTGIIWAIIRLKH